MSLRQQFIRLNLSTKIYLGFAIIVLLLVIMAATQQIHLSQVTRSYQTGLDTHNNTLNIVAIERNIVDLQRSVMAYTFSGYEGLIRRVQESRRKLLLELDALNQQLSSTQEQQLFSRMQTHFEQYAENFDSAINERRRRDHLIRIQMSGFETSIRHQLEQFQNEYVQSSQFQQAALAGRMLGHFNNASRQAKAFFSSPDSSLVNQARTEISLMQATSSGLMNQISPADQLKLSATLSDSRDYEQAFIKAVQATRTYMHLIYVVMAGEAAEIGFLADALKNEAIQHQEKVNLSILNLVDQSRLTSTLLFVIATVLGIGLAVTIATLTVAPIRRMTNTFSELANGNMEAEIPGKGRVDEIGAMAAAAQVFKEKARELNNASRYKSEFLANMSHELRTPLNSILLLARLIAANRDRNLTPSQVESARKINDSGHTLLKLINDILDLSKIEAGRVELVPERIDLDELLQEMERQFSHVAESRQVGLRLSLHKPCSQQVVSDRSKLEQVLRNFLSNALKFTDAGLVTLTIHRPSSDTRFERSDLTPSNCIAFEVSDSGIGIAPADQNMIFEAFRQVDGTVSRTYEGTGLGLSISSKLAQLLGGEIQLHSDIGEGATFTFYLPLKCPAIKIGPEPAAEQPTNLSSGSNGAAARAVDQTDTDQSLPGSDSVILIVDDNENNRFALSELLRPHVTRVLEASHGQEALDILSADNETPNIVLMDIMMPIMDGYQSIQAIRSQPRFMNLPIIALTAKTMAGDRERCLAAGASDYLPKPIDAEALFAKLNYWLKY